MYKLYSIVETKDTIFECWAASTKHPDSRFYWSDYTDRNNFINEEWQMINWLLACGSHMNFPHHAIDIAHFAEECFNTLHNSRREL